MIGIFSSIITETRFFLMAIRIFAMIKDVSAASSHLVPDELEGLVDKFSESPAFIEGEKRWNFSDFDAYANQVAHWALETGCISGDTVSVFVRNRLEYVAIWFGLSKVGVIPALLNYQLRAEALAHCVNISDSKIAIVDCELMGAWKSAALHLEKVPKEYCAFALQSGKQENRNTLKEFANFDVLIASQDKIRPDPKHRSTRRAGGLFMKMFTSGTTGLPKSAKIAHTRALYMMRAFVIPCNSTSNDRLIMVLPMYHATGGLCGIGMVLSRGGAVVVRRNFSVSEFWGDVDRFGVTLLMYVGELCRFLVNAPPHPMERDHQLRCIVGNGMAADIWRQFIDRFGVKDVVEFYGATEGNVNLMNVGGPIGAVGRIPPYLRKKLNGDLIRYDVETGAHSKGADGFCERVETGEAGELIGEIRAGESRFRFDGYQSKKASNKKILRGVFKKGDTWFRTGDLMRRDKDHYYYFVDRIGDTFRWRAENVSTGEIAAALTSFHGVDQANVYGVKVPHYDGRAGMASLVIQDDMDLAELHAYITKALPVYARPVFLRVARKTPTTATFKYKKTSLIEEGYDPAKVRDALFITDARSRSYLPLDAKIWRHIQRGERRL